MASVIYLIAIADLGSEANKLNLGVEKTGSEICGLGVAKAGSEIRGKFVTIHVILLLSGAVTRLWGNHL